MHQRRTLLIVPTLSALLLICAGLFLHSFPVSAAPPAATTSASAVVTDQSKLPVSNNFAMPPSQLRLTDAGDVYFTSQGPSALFRRDGAAQKRLLQINDPMPDYPGGLVNAISNLSVNSAGHVSMGLAWVEKGKNFPGGVFVYDGSTYEKVATVGETAPGTGGKAFSGFGFNLINASDQVAFMGSYGANAVGKQGLFLGAPGGPASKVALLGDPAPGTTGTFGGFNIRGLTNSGDVVFVAGVNGDPVVSSAIYRWKLAGGLTLVAKNGDPAPGGAGGTFGGFSGGGTLANGNGDVAFTTGISGAAGTTNRGIWVWDGTTTTKLIYNTDTTPLIGGGTYGGNFQLRGFNDSGTVLFNTNVSGNTGGVNHALFVDDVIDPAEVVFYRSQALPGGASGTFFGTQQAALNNTGAVAFLAALGGTPGWGWFLWTGGVQSKILLHGESLLGGTVGLAGRTGAPFAFQLNGGNDLVLTADILGLNTTVSLYWNGGTPAKIVGSDVSLPSRANLVIRPPGPRASDDEVLFSAFRAGGALTYFTSRLQGATKIRRVVGEGDLAPDGGKIINLGEAWINNNETVSVLAGAVVDGSGLYPRNAIYLSTAGATELQKLVAGGDTPPAPFAVGGWIYTGIQSHRLNNSDQVAFFGLVNNLSGGFSQGIFLDTLGSAAETVVALNDSAPVAGTVFQNLQPQGGARFAVNDNGLVVFDAVVRPTPGLGPDRYGYFAWSSGPAFEKVVLEGDVLAPGSTFGDSALPSFFKVNNTGQFVYNGLTYEGGDGIHLWRGPSTGLPVILAQTGTPAPGTTGATFSVINANLMDINQSGKVAFGAWLTDALNNETAGYFLYDGVHVLARLREGDPLPGGGLAGPAGGGGLGSTIALSDAGEVAMGVPDVTGAPGFSRYVIANKDGILRSFARIDEPAATTGGTFGRLYTPIVANSSGRFFFGAALAGKTTKSGIFVSK